MCGRVRAAAIGLLANISRSGCSSYLGSRLELHHGKLAGGNTWHLAEHPDDHELLLGSCLLLFSVDLTDQLFCAMRTVKCLNKAQNVISFCKLCWSSLSVKKFQSWTRFLIYYAGQKAWHLARRQLIVTLFGCLCKIVGKLFIK